MRTVRMKELSATRSQVIRQPPEIHHHVNHHVISALRQEFLVQEVDDIHFETQIQEGPCDLKTVPVGNVMAVNGVATEEPLEYFGVI
jgi:hypothetical protein